MFRRLLLLLLLPLLITGGLLYSHAEQIVLGAEAYIYGYPLVIVDVTLHHRLHRHGARALGFRDGGQ